MRQIGTLPNQEQANRFADYLVTQGMNARAEEDGDGWAIWVIDEEHVMQAAAELEDFQANPQDQRYAQVGNKAAEIRRAETERRRQANERIIEMRGRWSRGLTRRAPVTFLLIAVCVLVALLTGLQISLQSPVGRMLLFRAPPPPNVSAEQPQAGVFDDIQRGQVWRLVTPMLLHGGAIHLFFNMYMLYYFGGQMESRRGWIHLLVFVLLSSAVSNVAQAVIVGPYFGGFSGVNYAMFGYIWMQARFVPSSGFFIGQVTIIILVGWFFLGFLPGGMFAYIANAAHGGGLFFGIVVGYLPVLFPDLEGKL